MFCLYTATPILFRLSSATFFNLSILTSDFYILIFAIYFFKNNQVIIKKPIFFFYIKKQLILYYNIHSFILYSQSHLLEQYWVLQFLIFILLLNQKLIKMTIMN